MSVLPSHVANLSVKVKNETAKGYLIDISGESYFCIEDYDQMPPFLMSIVSSTDLWMYLSSNGSLTAGRKNYNNVLFPYETDDKIHLSGHLTGPKTIIRIKKQDRLLVWEPFADTYQGAYHIKRALLKNKAGNMIIFKEVNHDLQLQFSYSWMSSDSLGWIRQCSLENLSDHQQDVDVTDGLQNVLPWGILRESQSMMSTLMNAYKVAEWHEEYQVALYRMSSIPVDRPEPSEALRANIVWCSGLKNPRVLLSENQIQKLWKSGNPEQEKEIFGQPTSFFVYDNLVLEKKEQTSWYMCADVGKDAADIMALHQKISSQQDIADHIEKSVEQGSQKLWHLVSLADGIQHTGDKLNDNRHFSNVLFNIMRGGVFENSYDIDVQDFIAYLRASHKGLYEDNKSIFEEVEPFIRLEELLHIVRKTKNTDLIRLGLEYLPLSFSRRHGDPSRPWNFFDIRVKKDDGTQSLNYQGNWRDIFQNWEALAFSFPGFLPGMICRFLNTSTADGYNPYRLTRDGFEWEELEPDNPWAYIGYWGDHQIVYLLKLLEMHEKFFPGMLLADFEQAIFVFAHVPYRIRNHEQIVNNPYDTIIFDHHLHASLLQRSSEMGSDGKLLQSDGNLVKASFVEKLLVSMLTKMSNFVPEAGIWLNTQRPEWNDANNALVGNGASMVTLYHLRRYVDFLLRIVTQSGIDRFSLSEEVFEFYANIEKTLTDYSHLVVSGFSDEQRRGITDGLGVAGETYRNRAYSGFQGKRKWIDNHQLTDFLKNVLKYLNHSVSGGQRPDGLYHAYNLLEFSSEEIKIKPLQKMLEGQAAIIDSGLLDPEQCLHLMKSLFESDLYCPRRQSFMLYPFVTLPSFFEKNIIPREYIAGSKLLKELLYVGNTDVIKQDEQGGFHFHADLRNAKDLRHALDKLIGKGIDEDLVNNESAHVLELYEKVFSHDAFTGRSGSFYKYEGLGSIYWHMVSKLLLALGKHMLDFAHDKRHRDHILPLKEYYYRIKAGIGSHKNPADYGAFPTDPYSHTPMHMGAQQPGLTGQVKEDVLSRFNELGLIVEHGRIVFLPLLLQDADFSDSNELEFSFCNTKIICRKAEKAYLEVYFTKNVFKPRVYNDLQLSADLSDSIFKRSGLIDKIVVYGMFSPE